MATLSLVRKNKKVWVLAAAIACVVITVVAFNALATTPAKIAAVIVNDGRTIAVNGVDFPAQSAGTIRYIFTNNSAQHDITVDEKGAFHDEIAVPDGYVGRVDIVAQVKRAQAKLTESVLSTPPGSSVAGATPPLATSASPTEAPTPPSTSPTPTPNTPNTPTVTPVVPGTPIASMCGAANNRTYDKWNEHWSEAEWKAARPVKTSDGTWFFDAYAETTPTMKRRSEVFWSVNSNPIRPQEGDVLCYDALISGNLGAAGQSDDDWHVAMQTVGTTNGQWLGPIFGIHVRHGELRIGGGSARPDQDYASKNFEWSKTLAPYQDGKTYRVTLQAKLSSDVNQSWVSAWIDGEPVVSRWKPVSPQGLQAGTWYTGYDNVAIRSGLYRGTLNDAPRPTYDQWFRIKPIYIGSSL